MFVTPSRGKAAVRRLARARDALCQALDEKLTLEQVAREAALSPTQFIRAFKAVFGQTPHQVRIDARLDLAKRLLIERAQFLRSARATGSGTLHLPDHNVIPNTETVSMGLKIKLNSIMVDNQDKALKFYTEVLGFAKGKDIDVGNGFRWITVFAADGHRDVELVLEPNANPAGKTFQAALFQQSIPATAFEVDSIEAEYRRLIALGVVFTMPPTQTGPVSIAVFADTCGNLIQIYQPPK